MSRATPPTFRLDEDGRLVPCEWGRDVVRVPTQAPLDYAFGVAALLDVTFVKYTRHAYGRAILRTRHERRTLARRGTRGRRCARRVPAERIDEMHVYLPDGTAPDSPRVLAKLDAIVSPPSTP